MSEKRIPVLIVYRDGRPFEVRATDANDRGLAYYDFEYCRREGRSYFHESGGGPLSKTQEIGRSIPGESVWARSDIRLTCDGESIDPGHGWSRLEVLPGDPFADCGEDRCIECHACNDWLPIDWTDRPCRHVHWCDACAMWTGPVNEPCSCTERRSAAAKKGWQTRRKQKRSAANLAAGGGGVNS